MIGDKEYVFLKPDKFIEVNEGSRTYRYNHRDITYKDIVSICIRPSGSHRLNLKNGTKAIVQPGWLALDITGIDEWVF